MQNASGGLLRLSYRFLKRFYCSSIGNGDGKGISAVGNELGKLPDRRLYLRFKCGPCGRFVEKWLSKQAYDHGVIIVTCDSCKNRHLIADNMGWFPDVDRAKLPKVQEVKLESTTSTSNSTMEVPKKETDK